MIRSTEFSLLTKTILMVAALMSVGVLVLGSVQAQDTEEAAPAETSETAPAEATDENEASAENYTYVAQAQDSYTLMARKAVQTYGIVNNVNLSAAQIVYAETNITLAAGSPELALGQSVAVSAATVAEWVEKAEALSDEAEAAWQAYVVGVDFNTDNVGESR